MFMMLSIIVVYCLENMQQCEEDCVCSSILGKLCFAQRSIHPHYNVCLNNFVFPLLLTASSIKFVLFSPYNVFSNFRYV